MLLCLPFFAGAQAKFAVELSAGAFPSAFHAEPEPTVAGGQLPDKTYASSWQAGASFAKNLRPKTAASVGLRVASHPAKFSCDCSQFPSENNGNGGYQRDPALDDVADFTHVFLEMPLMVRQYFGERWAQPFAEAGIVPAFLAVNKRTSSGFFTIGNHDAEQAERNFQYAAHLGLGVSVRLSKKMALSLVFFHKPYQTRVAYSYQKMRLKATGVQVGLRF